MGQCGCGEVPIENAYRLPKGQVVAYHVYHGCEDCFSGPGISIYVYPNSKSEWLDRSKIEDFTPDEYGGNSGHGISLGLFEVDDLRAESVDLSKEAGIGRGRDDYASLDDWLADFGLRLIQGAMDRFTKRMDKMQKELVK